MVKYNFYLPLDFISEGLHLRFANFILRVHDLTVEIADLNNIIVNKSYVG